MSVIKGEAVVPSIDTELAAVKAAIYGEQVRGSIHDALQKTHGVVRDYAYPLVDTTDVAGAAIESKALGDILASFSADTDESIDALSARIDKIEYIPVTFTSFNLTPSTVLKGTTIASVRVTVGFSDTISRCGVVYASADTTENILVLDNVDGFDRTLTTPGSTSYFDISVHVQPKDYGSYKPPSFNDTKRVNFYNAIYMDQAANVTSFTDSFLTGLNSVISDTKGRTFTVTVETGNYIWYALPTRLGTPNFRVGVMDGGFRKVASEFEHTNSAGYKENYDIWRSDYPSLGKCTITVS